MGSEANLGVDFSGAESPSPPAPGQELQTRLDSISGRLRELETRVWDTRESGERIRERFIDALEVLDSRIAGQHETTVETLEHAILAISASLEDLKNQTRNDAVRNDEMVWQGVAKLEAKVSRIEHAGRETQDRLARAVATLTVAADEWRAATSDLGKQSAREIGEALVKLDDTVLLSQDDLSALLEGSLVTLAQSIQAWKDELVQTAQKTRQKVVEGLAMVDDKISLRHEGLAVQLENSQATMEESLKTLKEQVAEASQEDDRKIAAGLQDIEARLQKQMKDLEARLNERQAAMITLIIGGGSATGLIPEPEPPASPPLPSSPSSPSSPPDA